MLYVAKHAEIISVVRNALASSVVPSSIHLAKLKIDVRIANGKPGYAATVTNLSLAK